MSDTRDPVAVELGRRIEEAWYRAGYASRKAMFRRADLGDYNQLSRWCRGERMPTIVSLAKIAVACEVSLDWLVFGSEHEPDVFLAWLESPSGADATPEARRFLRSMPLHGYRPSTHFYDLALMAWKVGLSPDDAATAAKTTRKYLR